MIALASAALANALAFSHNPDDFLGWLWVVAAFAIFPLAAIFLAVALLRYYQRMRSGRDTRSH